MKQKKYINILIRIVLVFSIILSVFSSVIRFVITDKKTYIKLIEKSNTYAIVQEHLYEKMDSMLGNDISADLKKSIITEDDIKREADKVLDCMISNMIHGQANIPDIDTSVYNIRVAKALASLTGYEVNIVDNENKNITYMDDINHYLTPLSNKKIIKTENIYTENMVYNYRMDQEIVLNEIASRAELEAQGREMLKSMGYTEAEARKKMAEKGISESDVWNYLEANGYFDEENDSSNSREETDFSQNENQEKSDINHEESKNDNVSGYEDNTNINSSSIDDKSQDNEAKISKKKIQNIVISVISDNTLSFEEKMNTLSSKLIEEAQNVIGVEIQKLNLSEIINSDIFKEAVKITSFLYNSFYLSLFIMSVLFGVLLLLNKEDIGNAISAVGNSLFIAGGILSLIFGCVYLLKIYERLYLNFNKPYFEPMFFLTCDYFSKELFILSTLIFLLGILIKIQMMRKKINRR